ncbi:alpha/beta hydrolase [Nocardioides daejeonensis]|uniref:alpha/beta hydrolase n=1 Tax=Nocardioides daejeonensis TaxID=1046556 RepID=UPI000D74B490|nr:alpha/beta hydrolase [Nocardioides daejeonensis]
MTLDTGIAGLLTFMADAGQPPLHEGTPETARLGFNTLAALSVVDGGPIPCQVEETTVAGRPARVYRPDGAGPRPTVLFLHGGGWVIGDLDSHDQPCRRLATDTGAVVVALDYRLAPEHVFPAATEDALAAAREVAADLDSYGGDSRFGVAGDSAGGNLSAYVAQQVPEVMAQLLIYPSVDKAGDYASRIENGKGYMLELETMLWFLGHYVSGQVEPTDPRLSPMHGVRAGLPPAVVVTAGFDPLRDEGVAYADALESAGVRVERSHHDSLIHGFLDMGKFSPAADAAVADMNARFADLLGSTP